MTDNTSYAEVIAERRVGDTRTKIKYNRAIDDRGRRDYYSNFHARGDDKKVQIGKSENTGQWNIRNFDGDVETTSTAKFTDHSFVTELSDFGIDASDVFRMDKSTAKKPAKKSAAKKPAAKKKPAKKSAKKKTSSKKKGKAGGAKKKSKSKKSKKSKKKSKSKKSKKKSKKRR